MLRLVCFLVLLFGFTNIFAKDELCKIGFAYWTHVKIHNMTPYNLNIEPDDKGKAPDSVQHDTTVEGKRFCLKINHGGSFTYNTQPISPDQPTIPATVTFNYKITFPVKYKCNASIIKNVFVLSI